MNERYRNDLHESRVEREKVEMELERRSKLLVENGGRLQERESEMSKNLEIIRRLKNENEILINEIGVARE